MFIQQAVLRLIQQANVLLPGLHCGAVFFTVILPQAVVGVG
jgi:hypothetical protein